MKQSDRRAPYQLAALFVLLAACIGAVTYRYHLAQKRAIEREVRNQIVAIADMKVKQLREWRSHRIAEANEFLANPMTMSALDRLVRGHATLGERKDLQSWMNAACRDLLYANMVLTRSDGTVVAAAGQPIGGGEHLASMAQIVVRTGALNVSDFNREGPDGAIHLGLNIPLRRRAGEPVFGALLIGIDPRAYIYPLLQTWPVPSPTAETLLVRREGDQVVYLNDLRHRSDTALRLRFPLDRTDLPAVQAVIGAEGEADGLDYRGVDVIAGVRGVPETPWYLVAKIDLAEVESPIQRRSLLLAFAAFCLITAAGAGVFQVWRRQELRFYRAEYEAETQRRALMGHYDYLTRFANDIIVLANASGRIVEANDRAVSAYGYTREELLQLNLLDLRHPSLLIGADGGDEADASIFETVHQTREGRPFPVEASVRLIDSGRGRFRQMIVRDISERKGIQEALRTTLEALRESESRFRGIFEQAAVGMMQVSIDGVFLRVNRRFCEITGYSESELLGRRFHEITHPEDEPRSEEIRRSLLNGEVAGVELEKRYRRKDGGTVWVHLTVSVLRSESGEPQHFISTVEDITGRLRAAGALRDSESRFRRVVEHAPDGILIESGLVIQYANPAAATMLKIGQDQLCGRNLVDFVAPAEHGALRARAERVARRDAVPPEERTLVGSDGRAITVEISAVPIEYDYRPAALVFFRDITERKKQEAERVRLEEQLRHSQKMESIGRLAGGVAHDFNNLLTVINGYSQLLLDLEVDQDALRDGLEEIRAAGDRAASLTQQLLVFSRKQIAEFKPLNVNDIVRQEEKMLRRLIGENIEIVTCLDPSLGLVMADAGHVHQVLMNLTVNARDAMPEGGRIVIATWNQHVNGPVDADPDALPGPYAVLSVSDSGTGMTTDVMQRIFEPFFTTKPSGSGTGLGLSTVYGIVRQTKGFVSVSSKVGQGSVFRIFLPWTDHPVQCRETEAVAAEASGHGTALLVEDHDEVRKLAALVLAKHGYDVLEARDSAEALAIEASHAGPIHVLLTDMVMPGVSGLELGDRLRQRRADLRIVYMSGYTPGADTECSIPAASFLAKPFTPAGLLRKVRQATGGV